MLVHKAVPLKLLVEGEHGALRGGVDIASAAAAAKEDLARGSGGRERNGGGDGGKLGLGELAVVAGTAAAAVVDGGVVGEGVIGDDRHFDGSLCCW